MTGTPAHARRSGGAVMEVSDAVVVLDAGRRIAAGAPGEVQNDPAVLKAYLGAGEIAPTVRRAPLTTLPTARRTSAITRRPRSITTAPVATTARRLVKPPSPEQWLAWPREKSPRALQRRQRIRPIQDIVDKRMGGRPNVQAGVEDRARVVKRRGHRNGEQQHGVQPPEAPPGKRA